MKKGLNNLVILGSKSVGLLPCGWITSRSIWLMSSRVDIGALLFILGYSSSPYCFGLGNHQIWRWEQSLLLGRILRFGHFLRICVWLEYIMYETKWKNKVRVCMVAALDWTWNQQFGQVINTRYSYFYITGRFLHQLGEKWSNLMYGWSRGKKIIVESLWKFHVRIRLWRYFLLHDAAEEFASKLNSLSVEPPTYTTVTKLPLLFACLA